MGAQDALVALEAVALGVVVVGGGAETGPRSVAREERETGGPGAPVARERAHLGSSKALGLGGTLLTAGYGGGGFQQVCAFCALDTPSVVRKGLPRLALAEGELEREGVGVDGRRGEGELNGGARRPREEDTRQVEDPEVREERHCLDMRGEIGGGSARDGEREGVS